MKKLILATLISSSFIAQANDLVGGSEWDHLTFETEKRISVIEYASHIEDESIRDAFVAYNFGGKDDREHNRNNAAELVKALNEHPQGEAIAKDLSKFYVKSKWNEHKGEYEAQDFMSSVVADAAASGKLDQTAKVTFDGQTKTVAEWAKIAQSNRTTDYEQVSESNKEFAKKVEEAIKPEPIPPLPDDPTTDAIHELYNEGSRSYSSLDKRTTSNSARIGKLEQDMKRMGDKMLDLEDRMDGVVATSHAITNARPMVQEPGAFAVGAGIGAAGSKQAIAIGGAYQFNAKWSASTTINYETAGKRSSAQFSGGAGVHYKF